MYTFDGGVYVEEDDQCISCIHFISGIACPLLHALGAKVAFMEDECTIQNCGFYSEHVRSLKIVK